MCYAVNGHLTKASTAFAPVAMKYESQSLIHDRMMHHYRRIANAKPVIDNKPPKSIVMLMKDKDRLRRMRKERALQKELSRPSSSQSYVGRSRLRAEETLVRPSSAQPILSTELSESPKAPRYQSTPLLTADGMVHPPTYSIPTRPSEDPKQIRLNAAVSPTRSMVSHPIAASEPKFERHPRTPRYKIEPYEPDPELVVHRESTCNRSTSLPGPTNGVRYSETPRNMKTEFDGAVRQRLLDNDVTAATEDLKLLNVSAIERDDRAAFDNQSLLEGGQGPFASTYRASSKVDGINTKMMRLRQEERLLQEERRYLKFVEDITSDVLSRGIFSNRVLTQVFETHVERNKALLDVEQMWLLIEELRSDLQMDDKSTHEDE